MALQIITTGYEQYLGGQTNIHALVLGEPGAGKTRWSSFWPKPIFAGCEDGAMSLADRKVPFARIKTSRDMDELLLRVNTECQKPRAERSFLTLVIDTIDKYQRLVIEERLKAENKARMQGFEDWGYLDAKMQQLITKLGNLDMNVVVTCHVQDKAEEDGSGEKIDVIRPHLKGDIKDQLAAEFDFVGYMGSDWITVAGQTEPVLRRAIRWWPSPKLPILKDRSGQLPKYTPVTFNEDDYGLLIDRLLAPIDGLAETAVLETLETADDRRPAPVGPIQGGPTNPAPKAPPAKAPAKPKKAADKPADKTAGADAAPTTEDSVASPEPPAAPATDVADDSVPKSAEEALANLNAAGVDTTVVSEDEPDDNPEVDSAPAAAALTCGDGVVGEDGSRAEGLFVGCGKDLADENKDRVDLSAIKFRTHLCGPCYQLAKSGTSKKETSNA